MSTILLQDLIERAAHDDDFRARLTSQPEQALQPYADSLTAEETEALRASVAVLARRPNLSKHDWYRPNSFKEIGAAALSLILIVLLLYAAIRTYQTADAQPTQVIVGEFTQLIDPHDRARDLLNIFFPLFSAVVTFWLGVAVEGRRADRNEAIVDDARAAQASSEAQAEHAKAGAAEAQKREANTRVTARKVLADVAQLAADRLAQPARGGLEAFGGGAQIDPNQLIAQNQLALKQIMDAVKEGQAEIENTNN